MFTEELTSQKNSQTRFRYLTSRELANQIPCETSPPLNSVLGGINIQAQKLKYTFPEKFQKPDFKDSIKNFNFFKNQNRTNEDSSSKLIQHLFPNRKSISKEIKNCTLTKTNFRLQHENYKSHEKIPIKMKAPREFLKISAPEPIKIDQSHLQEKVKIIHNLYCKQDRYFYCNRIDIRALVRNIYYNGHTVDSLDEFKLTAFKRINNQQEFFGIIYEEGKMFTSSAHKSITAKIEKLVIKEIEGSGNIKNQISFIPFLSCPKKYERVVEELFNQFKHLEQVNSEIEKLTRHFIQFFMEKSSYECEGFNFHSRLFVIYVYNNQLIFRFFDTLFRMFKRNVFFENKYSETFEKVYEIYENSRQHTSETGFNFMPNNSLDLNEQVNEKNEEGKLDEIKLGCSLNGKKAETGNKIGVGLKTEKNQNIEKNDQEKLLNQKVELNLLKLKEAKTEFENMKKLENECNEKIEKGICENATKKKKKRKNKKKTMTEVSTALPEETVADLACKEETEQELNDLRVFENTLGEFDLKYQISLAKRMKIRFSEIEAELLVQAVKNMEK